MSEISAPPTGRRAWFGLLILLGPVLLVAMDGSVLFLAMPRLTAALTPTADQALWILDIYGFLVGSLLIAFGNIGDRYGRLRLLMIGAVVFGAASAGAGFSSTPEMLIAARALMGLAGATLLPSALAVLSELFPDPRRRAQAIGIFAATFAAGFAVGPVLGGLLLSRFWWGSVFLINLPVVAVFVLFAPVVLREVRTTRAGYVDALSVVLSAGGLLLAVYAVKDIAARGLAATTVVAALAGAALLVWFVRRQRGLEHPLVDVSLFRERVFTVAVVTGVLSLVAWAAAAYLTAIYLQSVLAMSVLDAALLTLPGAAVLTLTCIVTPQVVHRIGKRAALLACHAAMAVGLSLLLFTHVAGGLGWFVAAAVIAGGISIYLTVVATKGPSEKPATAAKLSLSPQANKVSLGMGPTGLKLLGQF